MLPFLGFFGSAGALVAAGWLAAAGWAFVWPGALPRSWLVFGLGCLCATLLALAAFYVALKPLDGVGISGVAGGAGEGRGADIVTSLANRFYIALAVVIAAELGICALITTLTRRAA